MRSLLPVLMLGIIGVSCVPIGANRGETVFNTKVRIFPSPLVSESDFINLANEDRAVREQALRSVSTYYNCLIKASPESYPRQDPTLLNRSQIVAFSEIPSKIHNAKMEMLANLLTGQNKSVMQSAIDSEIKELSGIKWDEIKREVSSFVGGGRKADLEKFPCPLPDSELQPQRLQLTQEWWLLRLPFFPPFM
jgi:hypothetical protein